MADITLTQVPWPAGTNVGAYPRKSEFTSDDGPPPGVPAAATKAVAANRSLAFTLPDGEYWACAPNGWKWQYVSFLAETPPTGMGEAYDDRLDAVEVDVIALEAKALPAPVEGTPVDLQMLAYAQATGKYIHKNPFFVDPVDGSWGPVSSTVDCVATFQAAVNFAIMGNVTDPALAAAKPMATRFAKWPVKVGIGTFRFDTKLKIYGVHGLRFEGSGEHTTTFKAGSVGQDHVLDINGCGNSYFEKFNLETDTGSVATCTSLMNVDSLSTVAKNSGPYNTFSDIRGSGKCVYGTTVGALGPNNGQDTYHHKFYHVLMYGQQAFPVNFTGTTASGSATVTALSSVVGLVSGRAITGVGIPANTKIGTVGASTVTLVDGVGTPVNATANGSGVGLRQGGWEDTTWYQAGFKLGGAFGQGNVLEHSFMGCNSANWRYGIHSSSVSVHWKYGSLQANGSDIHLAGPNLGGPCVFESFRGERSGRLLSGATGAVGAQVTLRDIGWESRYLEADGRFIQHRFAGQLVVDNVSTFGLPVAQARQLTVDIGAPDGAQVVDFRSCMFESLTGNPHPKNWLTSSAAFRGTWTVRGQSGTVIGSSGIPLDKPLAGPISNRDRDAPLLSFSATATNGSDILVSGSSTASASVRKGSTITGPNIPPGTTILAHTGTNNIQMSAAATGSGTATHATIAYPVDPADRYVGVQSTITGGATVNLPAIAAVTPGHEIVVKDESGTAATNNITIDGNAAELIEGALTKVINTNYGMARLKSTGTAWVVI